MAAAVARSEALQAEAAVAGAQRGAPAVRARRPLRCPDPAARSLRRGHLCLQTARTWAAGRAPGTYIQAVEAAVHAQSHRTAPRSQAVAAVAAAPPAVTPLAATPKTPRSTGGTRFYKVLDCPPPPGQRVWLLPGDVAALSGSGRAPLAALCLPPRAWELHLPGAPAGATLFTGAFAPF